MKIKVFGTGCTWFKRNNTSFLIDDKIVFDLPSGSYKDIIRTVNISDITTVLISHFHADHFGDMHVVATIFMRELQDLSEKKKVYGPHGILDRILKLNETLNASLDELSREKLTQNTDFVELDDCYKFKVADYNVVSYKMEHGRAETYGFVFEMPNGKKVGFSADTQMCDNLHNILKQSDYAFVEMASTVKRDFHLSIEEVEGLTKQYPNCKIYLVHTCDKCQQYAKDNNMNYLEDGQVVEIDE